MSKTRPVFPAPPFSARRRRGAVFSRPRIPCQPTLSALFSGSSGKKLKAKTEPWAAEASLTFVSTESIEERVSSDHRLERQEVFQPPRFRLIVAVTSEGRCLVAPFFRVNRLFSANFSGGSGRKSFGKNNPLGRRDVPRFRSTETIETASSEDHRGGRRRQRGAVFSRPVFQCQPTLFG
jgi:hypothetical protein